MFRHGHLPFLPYCWSSCCVVRNRLYWIVIRSFRHKGLRQFFESGTTARIQPTHVKRLRMLLAALETAHAIADMDVPGFRLHPLKGVERGRWSIRVNGNWRVTFDFADGHATAVDYEDYH